MSSIAHDKNGTRRLTFTDASGARRTIYLGKMPLRNVQQIKPMVDAINADNIAEASHSVDVSRWIAALSPVLRKKLERVNLIGKSASTARTLAKLITDYFATTDVRASTMTTYKQTERALVDYFGRETLLRNIGPEQAEKWRQDQLKTLSKATVSKRIKTARVMFATALDWNLIDTNPFKKIKAGGETNPDRLFFIDDATAWKVMNATDDVEFKLMFALSRWGGLRCPSEHLALTWGDIDLFHQQMTIREGKTKRRTMPLFPEVYSALSQQIRHGEWKLDASPVIQKYAKRNINLRKKLTTLLLSIGIKPWPRLFHNLRATRQTELVEHFAVHKVCRWLGNSERIARDHYLQVLDSDFSDAAGWTAQNPTRQPSPNGTNEDQMRTAKPHLTNEKRGSDEGTALQSDPDGQCTGGKSLRKTGRGDENLIESNARDAIPMQIRMKAALAVIDAQCASMQQVHALYRHSRARSILASEAAKGGR